MSIQTLLISRTTSRAQEALQKGKFPQAIGFFSKNLARNPAHLPSLRGRGYAYLKMERYPDAIRDFEAVLKHDPACTKTKYLLGYCFFKQKKLEEAKKILTEVIDLLRPEETRVSQDWGDLLSPAEAKISLYPYSDALSCRGLVYIGLGNYTEATADLQEAINCDPLSADSVRQEALKTFENKSERLVRKINGLGLRIEELQRDKERISAELKQELAPIEEEIQRLEKQVSVDDLDRAIELSQRIVKLRKKQEEAILRAKRKPEIAELGVAQQKLKETQEELRALFQARQTFEPHKN